MKQITAEDVRKLREESGMDWRPLHSNAVMGLRSKNYEN